MLIHSDEPAGDAVSTRLRLEGEFTHGSGAQLKEVLIKTMERHGALIVDCSAVSSIDEATLQVLCAAHRTAEVIGKSLSLAGLEAALARMEQKESASRPRACPLLRRGLGSASYRDKVYAELNSQGQS